MCMWASPRSGNRRGNSGEKSGTVSDSWLVIVSMVNYHYFEARVSLFTKRFASSYKNSCFWHSSCMVNTIAAICETYEFLFICVRFVQWFGVLLTNSWLIPNFLALFPNRLLHIVVNSSQYRGDSGWTNRIPRIYISYLFRYWIIEHHEWVEKLQSFLNHILFWLLMIRDLYVIGVLPETAMLLSADSRITVTQSKWPESFFSVHPRERLQTRITPSSPPLNTISLLSVIAKQRTEELCSTMIWKETKAIWAGIQHKLQFEPWHVISNNVAFWYV